MEEINNSLGMTLLGVQDRVPGYLNLDTETIEKLMASEDFTELTLSLQQSILGHGIPSHLWIAAEVDGCAMIVTNRWSVSIYGDSLAHCVSAFMKYRNAIATALDSAVVGEVIAPIVENIGPLHKQVVSRQRKRRFRNYVSKVGWLLAAGIVGTLFAILGNAIIGG